MSDTQQVASEGELLISVRASEMAGWIALLQACCGSRPVDAVAMCNDPVSEMRRCLERLQADVQVVLDQVVNRAGAPWISNSGNGNSQQQQTTETSDYQGQSAVFTRSFGGKK